MNSRYENTTYIRTTPEKLWAALIEPNSVRAYWNGAVHESSWSVGAPWTLVLPDGRVADSGEVLVFEKPWRLSVTWRSELKDDLRAEGFSRCEWALEPKGDITKLTITHEVDYAHSQFIAAASKSWPAILSGLKSLLETGAALDFSLHWPSRPLREG